MSVFWYSRMAAEDRFRQLRGEPARCPKVQGLLDWFEDFKEAMNWKGESNPPSITFCELHNGDIVEFTEMDRDGNLDSKPFSTYSDIVFLGYGEIYHYDTISSC